MTETLALLIPILAISIGLVAVVSRHRLAEQKLKIRQQEVSTTGNAIHRETEIEIQKLKDRVAVLERLLTDDDRRLADEISRLGGRGSSTPGV